MSRINAGKIVSVSSAVSEEKVLDSVAAIISERARSEGISFSLSVSGSKGRYVLMDSHHVERILMNLLSNSLKFTPEGGTILLGATVRYEGTRSYHTYVVKDNGIGMSDAFQKRMFLPFVQENSDGGYHDGTGLGLYIVKNLIELMGGTIRCESTLGHGTEFTVNLSYELATEEQIQLQTHRTGTFEDQVLYGKNVLLAEDNQINAEVIIKILSAKGIHAELASDGQEAVDMFRMQGPFHYQAILMDLMMPVLNGLDAAKRIRATGSPDAETIPIVALTADVTEDLEMRCQEAGINCAVGKPIDSAKLFAQLAEEFQRQIHSGEGTPAGKDGNKRDET